MSAPTPTPADDTRDDTPVPVSEITDARGMRPAAYAQPPLAPLEHLVFPRLEQLIAAGAMDAETLGVLDGHIAADEAAAHHDLHIQRVAHVTVCRSIIAVARMNVKQATRRLKAARRDLRDARVVLNALLVTLAARDPHLRNHS